MTITRSQAIEIARRHAARHPESYYSEPFQPHEWVIHAIMDVAGAPEPFVPTIGRVQELLRLAGERAKLNLEQTGVLEPDFLFDDNVTDEEVEWFHQNYLFEVKLQRRET